MLRLNKAVRDKRVSAVSEDGCSTAVKLIMSLFSTIEQWTEDIAPIEPAGRFGNKAFRLWHGRLVEQAPTLLKPILTQGDGVMSTDTGLNEEELIEEVGTYLCKCFGDEGRIDYGSGHEAMFMVVILCLMRVGVLGEDDDAAVVLLLFRRYLQVTRVLQTRYMLEPAGSHGVWGLDDYSFLPFLWGSSQLISSRRIETSAVLDEKQVAEHRDEYLYVDAIAFIREMKKGPFHEHSPMLYDISNVRGGWAKINTGMIKMYRGEVWAKRVVVQHFVFGKLFRYDGDQVPLRTTRIGAGEAQAPVAKTAEIQAPKAKAAETQAAETQHTDAGGAIVVDDDGETGAQDCQST